MYDDDRLHLKSSRDLRSTLAIFVSLVIAFHLLLLYAFISFETSTQPKPSTKIIVQTIKLNPLTPKEASLSPFLQANETQAKDPQIAAPLIEDVPLKEEILAQNEQIHLLEETVKEIEPLPLHVEEPAIANTIQNTQLIAPPIPHPPAPAKPPAPAIAPSPAPKPAVVNTLSKEKAKEAAKKPPVKKPSEKKDNAKNASSIKSQQEIIKKKDIEKNQLAEKKRHLEKIEAEKKRLQKLAEEKKQLQAKAAAEKKRQDEIAEKERKRKEEADAAKEAARQKVQAHLSKAKENLAKIGETRDKIASNSSINIEMAPLPKELGLLQVDAFLTENDGKGGAWGLQEVSYSDEVAYRLKVSLRLPDYGSVKIKLTLERSGKVVKLETVQTQSQKNKAYVESKVPTILFPPFGQRFSSDKENTFTITLQNDS